MQRKLFVSHSSKTPENLALLQDVCTGLGGKGFEILVDRGGKLYAGVDWELRLNEWMAECHAAVILFSKAALDQSDWVKKEAAILTWRRALQEDFALIPVLLEDVVPEDLEKGLFGELGVRRNQFVTGAPHAQQIVEAVSAGLGPAGSPQSTPFERLETVLASILEEQAKSKTLEDSWAALEGQHKPPWQPSGSERFASAFIRFMLRNRRLAVESLTKVLDHIRPRVDRDAAEELLKYLACLWVDAEAAAGISSAPARGVAVGLNGNYLPAFTAERYAERAWPLSDRWRLIQVDGSQRTVDAICEVIREEFRPKGPTSPPVAAIDRRINRLKEPVVVLLPASGADTQLPDRGLIEALRQVFPRLIYLIGTGPGEPSYVPEGITILRPLLDLEVEENQYFALDEVRDFINNRLYGKP